MRERKAEEKPRARREGMVVRELEDEVLVYDLERDRAHCLNRTAAAVWKQCDGAQTVREMTKGVEAELGAVVDERVVWYAVAELSKDNLLQEKISVPEAMFGGAAGIGMTRRQMMQALGVAAVVAVPVVSSILAPTAQAQASCLPKDAPCTLNSQCCSGNCLGQGNGTCSR